jgi:hypothetical protein
MVLKHLVSANEPLPMILFKSCMAEFSHHFLEALNPASLDDFRTAAWPRPYNYGPVLPKPREEKKPARGI